MENNINSNEVTQEQQIIQQAPPPPKKKKKKFWLICLILIVVIVIIIASTADGNSDNGIAETGDTLDTADVGTTDPQEIDGGTDISETPQGVTAETFRALRIGMTPDEVIDLIGTEPFSESTTEFMGTTTTLMMWSAGFVNSISVTFTDGHASWLMQVGLDTAPEQGTFGVTHDAFSQIRNGKNVDAVQAIIGVLPNSIMEVEFLGTTTTTIMWGDEL